eukprot:m.46562 g.46562  ORF g.46562 m.46562 type:complete len:55 (-) comp10726_c1_seq1:22-186(-)
MKALKHSSTGLNSAGWFPQQLHLHINCISREVGEKNRRTSGESAHKCNTALSTG